MRACVRACVCVCVCVCMCVCVCLCVCVHVRAHVILLWIVGCGLFECCCIHTQYLSFFAIILIININDTVSSL